MRLVEKTLLIGRLHSLFKYAKLRQCFLFVRGKKESETYPQLGYRLMNNLSTDLAMKVRNPDLRICNQN